MAEARMEHVQRCTPETFWKVFFDDEYNRRLFREVLAFPVFEQRAFEENERQIRRVLYVSPKVSGIPAPLKPLLGDGLAYTEEGIFDKASRVFRIEVTPSKMPEKVTIRGSISAIPIDEARCRRVFEVSVKASIFGIGGLLEKQIIADMQQSQARAASFADQFTQERAL